jgi:hypothetical protein
MWIALEYLELGLNPSQKQSIGKDHVLLVEEVNISNPNPGWCQTG